MKRLTQIIFMLMVLTGSFHAQDLPDPETRGVWITGNFFKGSEAIETLVENLYNANFNTLFVDVWYRGSTIYPSDVLEAAGAPKQLSEFTGTDPLREIIDVAHKHNMEVFAWFEYGFAVGYGTDENDPPSIIDLHPDWSMKSRAGKITESDDYGGHFFWIDPSVNGAADFMVDLYTECAAKYPDIDGVELDRMRYPYTTFSYSDTARAKFMSETGKADPLTLTDNNADWSAWRRLQVTNVVKRTYESVKKVNPQCIITGAVVPPYMMYGSGDDKLQAWDVWAKKSYVDILEPMLYLPLSDYSYQLNLCKNYAPSGFQLAPGIAISSVESIPATISEIKTTRNAGMAGEIIWYYGYLLSYANAFASFKSDAYPAKTIPTHNDLIIDNTTSGVFKTTGDWTTGRGGYKGYYKRSSGAAGDTATFLTRILREGNYSLYGYWTGDSATNSGAVSLTINGKDISKTEIINQQKNLDKWNYIDIFHFNSGDTVTVKVHGSGGSLIADAFRFRRNSSFTMMDYVVQDSQTVLVKLSNRLLSPISQLTEVSSSISGANISASVDATDGAILSIKMDPVEKGIPFTITVKNLISASYDTLSFFLDLTYEPDKTEIIIDDSKPNSFWKLLGTWTGDTNSAAYNKTYWLAKQTGNSRVQWGPYTVQEDGYYDVFVKIPDLDIPFSEKCLYTVRDKNGVDSVYVSQSAAEAGWLKLGNYSFKSGSAFSVILSSVSGTDTAKYIIADAVMLKRALEDDIAVKPSEQPKTFVINQNYPNPFNSQTIISFSVNEQTKVYIKIYNSLGQEVADILNGENYSSGTWKVPFNGNFLPSGVYFARVVLKTANYERQSVLKMSLIK
ncbi:MAG TPA: family 10 glycosylhydrolase [Ignavibacteriales bacterium]|nr:family 10 glycosylhydrolase [Ignavibacteriales bacterium]